MSGPGTVCFLSVTLLLGVLNEAAAEQKGVMLSPLFGHQVFNHPVAMLQQPTQSRDWYVVEKGGRIVRIRGEGENAVRRLFADITDRVDARPAEAGLLGMVFHPGFAENGLVFLSYTRGKPLTSVLSRFASRDDGLTLDTTSEEVLLTIRQPYRNHNGGHVAFGPDGYLYYGLGDGGAGGDPHGNGQNTDTLLGSILRIDVDGGTPYAIPDGNPFVKGGGRPEIYAYGLRNPWRWSFDRQTGALWVGDVGQSDREEIDRVAAGDNLGWNRWEGSNCYRAGRCSTEGVVMPVAEYSHTLGCSVTGGYVYRGRALPLLKGQYLYGDFCSGRIWVLDSGKPVTGPRILLMSGKRIASFAEDREGELYVLDYQSGGIFRFVAGDVSE